MKVPIPPGADSPGPKGSVRLAGGRLRLFRASLLAWYRPRARSLAIRSTTDPWALLVAEIMAQQTQIARVDEAWVVFMARYPDPAAMASAPVAQVVRDWAGLGYNRRAVNLQRAARLIVDDHGGVIPATVQGLEALPGVGPYTARAVAATAFGLPVAPVDTNVRRVVSRVTGVEMAPPELQAEADRLMARDVPADWAHGSMELGAIVCRSRDPRCDACPVARWCASAGQVTLPQRTAPAKSVPFEMTTRWLRGRIVDVLRGAEPEDWTQLPSTMGGHDEARIMAAVEALARDGLLERGPDGAVRLPSGTT